MYVDTEMKLGTCQQSMLISIHI